MRKFYSPLRYPGGKSKLAKFLALLCEQNNIDGKKGHYIEPYAGGASVALFLLFNGNVSRITINDSDRAIYAVWHCIVNDAEAFVSRIQRARVNLATWKKCKKIQENKDNASLADLGFSTFFLNRTNVSGIIDGGVIGGLEQQGKYKIDCRFNKRALIERIRTIAARAQDIEVTNLDALELVKRMKRKVSPSTIFYFDPPYYLKGESLYLNHYNPSDHEKVSDEIQKIENAKWVVSYDAADEIKKLYRRRRTIEYSLLHTARTARMGAEVLFFSDNMFVPKVSDPTKV